MDGIIAAFFSGSAASALISGIFALVQARLRRGKQHSDTEQALVDGMKFILLDVIAQRAMGYIQTGEVELRDKQLLRRMHQVNHTGLGGNGDLDALMEQVDKLPVRLEPWVGGERGET